MSRSGYTWHEGSPFGRCHQNQCGRSESLVPCTTLLEIVPRSRMESGDLSKLDDGKYQPGEDLQILDSEQVSVSHSLVGSSHTL